VEHTPSHSIGLHLCASSTCTIRQGACCSTIPEDDEGSLRFRGPGPITSDVALAVQDAGKQQQAAHSSHGVHPLCGVTKRISNFDGRALTRKYPGRDMRHTRPHTHPEADC
jgi:hypothetical protein